MHAFVTSVSLTRAFLATSSSSPLHDTSLPRTFIVQQNFGDAALKYVINRIIDFNLAADWCLGLSAQS